MARTQRHKRLRIADTSALEAEIAQLENLSVDALRVLWKDKLACEAPPVRSRGIMRRLLAFELQAAVFGGHDAATTRKLDEVAKALDRDGTYEPHIRTLRAGVVLTREWKGVLHQVSVVPNGFEYSGNRHKSLSDIARLITGTRWSGPRFFGLEQKKPRRAEALS